MAEESLRISPYSVTPASVRRLEKGRGEERRGREKGEGRGEGRGERGEGRGERGEGREARE